MLIFSIIVVDEIQIPFKNKMTKLEILDKNKDWK